MICTSLDNQKNRQQWYQSDQISEEIVIEDKIENIKRIDNHKKDETCCENEISQEASRHAANRETGRGMR